MSKWTVDKIIKDKRIIVGTFVSHAHTNKLFWGASEGKLYTANASGVRRVIEKYELEQDLIKFYDANMKLIEPPKEREFDIIVEHMHVTKLKTKFFIKGSCVVENMVEIPNGRRYKRYKDNGELESC